MRTISAVMGKNGNTRSRFRIYQLKIPPIVSFMYWNE